MSAKGKSNKTMSIVGNSNNAGTSNNAIEPLKALNDIIVEIQQASALHASAVEVRDLVAIDHKKIEAEFTAIKQKYDAISAHLADANADVNASASALSKLRAQFGDRALAIVNVPDPAEKIIPDAPEVSVKVLSMKTVYVAENPGNESTAVSAAAPAAAPVAQNGHNKAEPQPESKFKTVMKRVNEHDAAIRIRDLGVKNNLTPKIFSQLATAAGDGIYTAVINKVQCVAVVFGGIPYLSRGPGKITMVPKLKRLFQAQFASDACRADPSAHGYYDADLTRPGLPRNSPTILGCYDTDNGRDLGMPNGAAYFSISDWRILERGLEGNIEEKMLHEAILRVDSAVATAVNFFWRAMLFQELLNKYNH